MGNLWVRRVTSAFLIVFLMGTSFTSRIQAQQLQRLSGPLRLPQYENNQADLPPGFQIVSSTSTSIVLDIHAPSYSLERVVSKGQSCLSLKADGYYQTSSPGEPGLLSVGVMFGVPVGSTPTLKIKSIETLDIPGDSHLCPVTSPIIQSNPSGLVDYVGETSSENKLTYSRDVFIPSSPVAIETSGMIRSQQVARVNYTLFIYNPVRDELRIINHITIEIDLGDNEATRTINDLVDEGTFESLLQKTLINYNQARNWRLPHQQTNSVIAKSAASVSTDQPVFKIQVNQDGLYQVTYAALQSAGVPVDGLDPRTFKLLDQGIEIPLYILGEEDGDFNSEDKILFYGQKINTKYTTTNIYWLSWGIENGLRMSARDGSIHDAASPVSFFTSMHLEEDHTYFRNSPSGSQYDHWYWEILNANGVPVSRDFTFILQNLDRNSSTAKVRGLLKGYYADPHHHTRIYLNGHLIDDHTWLSISEYSFSIDIDQSFLVEGTNTLTVECPLDDGITVDQVLVNWFDIDYYHTYTSENNSLVFDGNSPGVWEFHVGGFSSDAIDVFDITNPSAPVRIVGGSIIPIGLLYQVNFEQQISVDYRYMTVSPSSWLTPTAIDEDDPSTLKDSSNGADYIIISPADFLTAISPLASYRANQGMRVKVVDVQDIYDEFNGGVFDPQAIQSYLAYTYSHWSAPCAGWPASTRWGWVTSCASRSSAGSSSAQPSAAAEHAVRRQTPSKPEGHIGQVVPLEDGIAILRELRRRADHPEELHVPLHEPGDQGGLLHQLRRHVRDRRPAAPLHPGEGEVPPQPGRGRGHLPEFNRRGYIGTIWYGPYPYINNLCSCASPECAGLRPRLDYGIMSIYKAEYVLARGALHAAPAAGPAPRLPVRGPELEGGAGRAAVRVEDCFGCGVCRHACRRARSASSRATACPPWRAGTDEGGHAQTAPRLPGRTRIRIDYTLCGGGSGVDPRACADCLRVCEPAVFTMHQSFGVREPDPLDPQAWSITAALALPVHALREVRGGLPAEGHPCPH